MLSSAVGRDLSDLPFFGRADVTIGGVPVGVSRTGYSGDLGFELFMPFESALPVWDALIKAGENYTLRVAGMEALDVARLEAGLIMAGHRMFKSFVIFATAPPKLTGRSG